MEAKTEASLAKQQEKERRELERLRREKARPKGPGYMIYFIMIITVIYIADEVASQIGTQMQTILADQIFAPVFGAEYAVARMSTLGMVTVVFGILAFFYKPLSDRFGRKIFLVINTLGMGLGMLLVGIATNVPVYLIGACVIGFFIPHDMQATYIYESTPAKHRAKIYSVVKACASLGVLLVPVLRNAFIPSTDLSGWRMVYMVPAAVTLAISVFALFFVRESDAYLDSRIHQLEMTEEEKQQQEKEKRQEANRQPGIVSGLKFICSHKQLLWLCIANGFMTVGLIMTMYYETTMTYGFAQHFLAEGMDLDAAKLEATGIVTLALMMFPIGSAVFQMMQGFFSDSLGRKPAAIIMSAASLISFATFFVGAQQFWNPYVVGFFAGAAAGSYWAAGDIIGLMMTESAPTRLRTSSGSAGILIYMPIALVFIIMFVVAMNVMGDEKIGILCMIFAGLGLAVGLLILSLKTKETKGVDLGEVRGDEFE